jgi:hypothetical protein
LIDLIGSVLLAFFVAGRRNRKRARPRSAIALHFLLAAARLSLHAARSSCPQIEINT